VLPLRTMKARPSLRSQGKQSPIDLETTYISLHEKTAALVAGGEAFWGALQRHEQVPGLAPNGWLIAVFAFSNPWENWEMHPEGDELVLVLEGQVDFHLELNPGEVDVFTLRVGNSILVPKGLWHTCKTNQYTKLLHVTAGRNTINRSVISLV
jgi:mannose-6-phosphate isomerase-like protein (cupin superfamily)